MPRKRAETHNESDPTTKLQFDDMQASGLKKIQEVPEQDHEKFCIDDLFGKIFGIERVHILKKSDSLKNVIEKITLAPENKLVY